MRSEVETVGRKATVYRPKVKVRPRVWKNGDGTELPGVAIYGGAGLQAHLTPNQARAMADRLHDLADQLEKEES